MVKSSSPETQGQIGPQGQKRTYARSEFMRECFRVSAFVHHVSEAFVNVWLTEFQTSRTVMFCRETKPAGRGCERATHDVCGFPTMYWFPTMYQVSHKTILTPSQRFPSFRTKTISNPKDDKTQHDAMVGVYSNLECPKPLIPLNENRTSDPKSPIRKGVNIHKDDFPQSQNQDLTNIRN